MEIREMPEINITSFLSEQISQNIKSIDELGRIFKYPHSSEKILLKVLCLRVVCATNLYTETL